MPYQKPTLPTRWCQFSSASCEPLLACYVVRSQHLAALASYVLNRLYSSICHTVTTALPFLHPTFQGVAKQTQPALQG